MGILEKADEKTKSKILHKDSRKAKFQCVRAGKIQDSALIHQLDHLTFLESLLKFYCKDFFYKLKKGVFKMKNFFLALALVAMVSTSSMANVASDCGCGLGQVIIGQKSGFLWNLLGTCLNGTLGNQTLGMTTGTLGCRSSIGGKLVKNEKLNSFVADNLDNLAIDIASGNGESLNALAELAQIDDKVNFFAQLKANFDSIYSSANVDHKHVVKEINNIIANI